MRMKIHHPSASLGAGSGTEITEKTLWKPKLRVLRVSMVNDFRRRTYQSRFPSSVILSAGRRGDRSRRTPIAAGLQNAAAWHSNNLEITCGHRGPSTPRCARRSGEHAKSLTLNFMFRVPGFDSSSHKFLRFVSGHDFSRAQQDAEKVGALSPCTRQTSSIRG